MLIKWCVLIGCCCVTLAFCSHDIQTLKRQRRATQEELESAADALDSVSAAFASVPGSKLNIVGSIFASVLSLTSLFVRIAAGTQEDEESRLMAQFTLVLSRLDDLEANQDEIKKILVWSDNRSNYEAYTRTIKVLFDKAKQYLENPQNRVLKEQFQSQTASAISVDEFYNFVTGKSPTQKYKLFEAAFHYFDYDMRKTEVLMKDSIGWLIQGMVVQMVAPLASNYSGSVLANHLHLLDSEWQFRMNTTLNAIHDFQDQTTRNAINYITESTNMFFEEYPDKSDHPINNLREKLENELNTKYYYTNTRVVALEDDHHGSCVYSQKPQYTCDGIKDRKPKCPKGRNFVIFTYPSKYERMPDPNEIDMPKTEILWNPSRGLGSKEFIANTKFSAFTSIVIDKTREYVLPRSDCFVITEQMLEFQNGSTANFRTLVDVCSPLNETKLTTECYAASDAPKYRRDIFGGSAGCIINNNLLLLWLLLWLLKI